MAHDFKRFPELTNSQLDIYYFESPHKQIFEDFRCEVIKVHDGDTITVRWFERDFDFPIRLLGIDAPELSEEKGAESKYWLESLILNKKVDIEIDPKNRVEKYGRLLGNIIFNGINLGEEEVNLGKAKPFAQRTEGKIPELNKELRISQWLT